MASTEQLDSLYIAIFDANNTHYTPALEVFISVYTQIQTLLADLETTEEDLRSVYDVFTGILQSGDDKTKWTFILELFLRDPRWGEIISGWTGYSHPLPMRVVEEAQVPTEFMDTQEVLSVGSEANRDSENVIFDDGIIFFPVLDDAEEQRLAINLIADEPPIQSDIDTVFTIPIPAEDYNDKD